MAFGLVGNCDSDDFIGVSVPAYWALRLTLRCARPRGSGGPGPDKQVATEYSAVVGDQFYRTIVVSFNTYGRELVISF